MEAIELWIHFMMFVKKYRVDHQKQNQLKSVVSLKTFVGEEINPLERTSKDNSDAGLREEEAITVACWSSNISSMGYIQHFLPSVSSRRQPLWEKMKEILENCKSRKIQRKIPKASHSTTLEKERFLQKLLSRDERQDKYHESMESMPQDVLTLTQNMTLGYPLMGYKWWIMMFRVIHHPVIINPQKLFFSWYLPTVAKFSFTWVLIWGNDLISLRSMVLNNSDITEMGKEKTNYSHYLKE